jgi:uncharacterized membrane protein SpoIIM required for sporulation
LKETRFLRKSRADWSRLEAFAARLGSLDSKELLEFISLYRKATSDLARARTLGARSDVVDYLNQLVGRIHFQVYTTPGWSSRRFLRFFTHWLPQTFRRCKAHVIAATLLLVLPAVAGYIAVGADPALIRVFAPPQFVELIDRYGTIEQRGPGEMSAYTSFYIVNNVTVSFLTFTSGLLLGLGSFYNLVKNGAILGAMLAAVGQAGATRPFVSFISAHGGIEMFAIVLAGAAGLRIGTAMINPGEVSRARALVEAGRDAGTIMFGVVLMLLIAAVVEAWISPSPNVHDVAKWILGVLILSSVVAYYTLAGREPLTGSASPSARDSGSPGRAAPAPPARR